VDDVSNLDRYELYMKQKKQKPSQKREEDLSKTFPKKQKKTFPKKRRRPTPKREKDLPEDLPRKKK
jgi:hypothetical protein